ncbi:MAG: hypothetical protein KF900_09440 [Bacteroidetes bacterium]|nr:hypothetical protein [Bacteroidota bacterium]
MANWKKIITGTAIGAGIAGIITYITRMKRTSVQLETVAKASIHSLKTDGLTVRIDLQLKNPTNSTFKIKFPFVKVLYADKVIGSSQVINKDITIPAYGEAVIESIMIKMPLLNLLSLGAGLYNLLVNKKEANILISTITTIDLGWKQLPYETTSNITLKPAS